jgi:hypothetical protein
MVKDILKTELNYIYKMSFLQSNIEEKSTEYINIPKSSRQNQFLIQNRNSYKSSLNK